MQDAGLKDALDEDRMQRKQAQLRNREKTASGRQVPRAVEGLKNRGETLKRERPSGCGDHLGVDRRLIAPRRVEVPAAASERPKSVADVGREAAHRLSS